MEFIVFFGFFMLNIKLSLLFNPINPKNPINQLFGVSDMKKNTFLFGFLLLSLLSYSLPASAQEKKGAVQAAASIKSSREYKIGSGDILQIMTWKEPDFSRDALLVRIDGKITFPLLGDIQAAGHTPVDLKKEIETKLKEYVDNPIVTVTIINPGSQKFYILGEVKKTGEYDLIKELRVLQAFALAGGFTEWAKKEIMLLRYENGKEKVIRINYKNISRGEDLSQNIELKANDTIIVP
jgi:polysaccharide export outer membrane protein